MMEVLEDEKAIAERVMVPLLTDRMAAVERLLIALFKQKKLTEQKVDELRTEWETLRTIVTNLGQKGGMDNG